MCPIGVEINSEKYILSHRCNKCGMMRKNKIHANNDFNAILKISTNQVQ